MTQSPDPRTTGRHAHPHDHTRDRQAAHGRWSGRPGSRAGPRRHLAPRGDRGLWRSGGPRRCDAGDRTGKPARDRGSQRRRQEHAAQAHRGARPAVARPHRGPRQPAGREAHRIAYVPQAELVDWGFPVTVGDVVMMGRFPRLGPIGGPAGRTGARSTRRSTVGMAGFGGTQIGRLSGGQRRRVFLARALSRSRTYSCSMSRSRASTRRARKT